MAIGLADQLMSWEDILAQLDVADTPARPGFYQKRGATN
jgi:hypothetical protein